MVGRSGNGSGGCVAHREAPRPSWPRAVPGSRNVEGRGPVSHGVPGSHTGSALRGNAGETEHALKATGGPNAAKRERDAAGVERVPLIPVAA